VERGEGIKFQEKTQMQTVLKKQKFITRPRQNDRSRTGRGQLSRSESMNRRQRAVRQGFDPRHMKSGMYTEGTGKQKTNSRGANDLRDGEGPINRGEGLRDSTWRGRFRLDSHTLCPR
jgi:hypothetical protein